MREPFIPQVVHTLYALSSLTLLAVSQLCTTWSNRSGRSSGPNVLNHFLPNWHIEVIAAKLEACRQGKIRRLIINVPPRHLKSICGSISLPAWILGHDPSAQILCVSYGQDLWDKLARDCPSVLMSKWFRRIFATRLAAQRHAVEEFVTTC